MLHPARTVLAVVVLGLVPALGGACHHDDSARAAATPAPSGNTTGATLAFAEPDTLELSLGQAIEVDVTLTPASPSPVRFALLGDYADAALSSVDDSSDLATALPDGQGHARILVHAPTRPATFALRASVDGGPTAVRGIGASGDGFATIVVLPSYSGKRDASSWTATAAVGQSCVDHLERPVTDGPLSASSQGTDPLVLAGVPVGTKIMVTLRSQQALSGCVDLAGVDVNETRMLTVKAENVPAVLGQGALEVQLSLTPDAASFASLVTSWGARFRDSFLGGAKASGAVPEGTRALLDTMALTFALGDAAVFQSTRQAAAWDSHLASTLAAGADPAAALATWLDPALQKLTSSPAGVVATLLPGPVGSGAATMTPRSLLGIDTSAGDVLLPSPTTLTLDADDLLHLAGKLGFWPSRVVARAVTVEARASGPGITSVPQALGQRVSCSAVATTLDGKAGGLTGCDVKCLTIACNQALATMWDRAGATDEQAQQNGTLTFAATGALSVDGNAAVLGFDGTWVGGIGDAAGDVTAKHADAKGTVTGKLAQ